MKPFIKKEDFNFIKKCITDLRGTLRNCTDPNIIETNKAYINEKILSRFSELSNEEKELIDINKITDPLHIDKYLEDLNEYVYGMTAIKSNEITKLFRKEKKLKIPNLDFENSKKVYLGWIDEGSRKLFIAYNLNGKLTGMACKIPSYNSSNNHICTLCNHIGNDTEVAFVSAICKTSNPEQGTYRSIGFDICLDSEKCNERITSTDKLEKLLKDVNNIKK
ncbi:FusB/FusC family EF-G-binding protein [Clostridium perfringens]|uniref:FusB/FusC family EF-G-binding protein n=1 Tax=Clostridium perfringens TaxID=1502 RepID=UPI002906FFA3|nr:FusB/FusC family EF-G-binding protein [Clostridium perfringens]EJT6171234.1 FusB/FusC family EF-G-binding protein [Clostridium perfringens]EJT6541959.1 FusB/FusC family EF-G-binding protein [Clostridium perfringens]EJT6566967.1 FusB/FusC family EF-G-binding protein [Clostridium perfringens]MBS5994299.1 FusB/FusC family EF-G-binding protein [Clostridium perfringens]MDM0997380.1 FusB/FusC family EF-G-binding protein [Clostridium perfringens]